MNYETFCLELLSQDAFLQINKKLLATLGLEKAVYISLLIDKYKQYKKDKKLKNGYFFLTDNQICLYSGLKSKTIKNLKSDCKKEGFIFIKKEGIPLKTYYNINFYKVFEVFNLEKEIFELNYERIFKEELNIENITFEKLKKLSLKQLQILCQKYGITYYGYHKKIELISIILDELKQKEKIENLENDLSKNDILKLNFKNLRKTCKILNISYSGLDNKENLQNKILNNLEKKVDRIVCKKINNKWTTQLSTSEQNNCNKLKLNTITNNQKQITTTSSSSNRYNFLDLEKFNLLNKVTINNIRKNIKNLDFIRFKNVYDYVKKKFDEKKVKNFNAFLYETLNQEWDINLEDEEVTKKELDFERKKWLNYYSGIISNQVLKEEIEKIIIDIPLELLNKNKSKLGMMNGFEFKQHLCMLKKQSILS